MVLVTLSHASGAGHSWPGACPWIPWYTCLIPVPAPHPSSCTCLSSQFWATSLIPVLVHIFHLSSGTQVSSESSILFFLPMLDLHLQHDTGYVQLCPQCWSQLAGGMPAKPSSTHVYIQFLHTSFMPVPVHMSHPNSEHIFNPSSGASHINSIFCTYATALSALSHPPGAYHSLPEVNLLIPPLIHWA